MRLDRATDQAVIESLADGVPLDWAALDAQARTDRERRRYRHLRLVARIAELHRTMAVDQEEEAGLVPAGEGALPPIVSWGHLQIERRLSEGSFGEVYVARDPQLDVKVALKLLRPGASQRPVVARLLAEAQTLARVHHSNVVVVHGADVREGRAGLWMELVNGHTLEEWLREHGQLGAGEASAVGRDVCRALAAVHAAGLVHGDVKAQNVMREVGGRIVLMDFGSVHAQGSDSAAAGTPLYLAPEVLAGEPPSPRSDIYSVGVLLFHLLTGRYPLAGDGIDGLRAAHAAGARVHLRDLRPELPATLVAAVERALENDPAMRFATPGVMERALAGSSEVVSKGAATLWKTAAAILAVAALGLAWRLIDRASVPSPVHSIAVTGFSGSGSDDQSYLMLGLANDVVRELQRFEVHVKRATSVVGVSDDAQSLDERLGADVIASGVSVRDGDDRRLRVRLRRAGGAELWSNEYVVREAALPSLARTIAQEVTSALGLGVRPDATAPGHQTNYRAYDAYQRGRTLSEQRNRHDLLRSLEYFKQAAALDPLYAEPWAGMADSYNALGVPPFGDLRPIEARRLAKESALEALDRDPNLAEAHASLAWGAALFDWDWAAAEARFNRAIELNPQYSVAHHLFANYLTDMGRFEEAHASLRRAQALEPLSILIHRDVAWIFFCEGRYGDAIAQLRETLAKDPNYTAAITLLARSLAANRQYDDALRELRKVERLQDISRGSYLSFRGWIEAVAGMPAAGQTVAELREVGRGEYVSPYYFALVYAALGERTRALDELERAFNEQDPTLGTVNVDPRFGSIRGEPRFRELIERMRFPAPQR